jgi:hypothetical protein
VVNGAVAGLEIVDDRLTGVRMGDGRLVPRAALVVAPRMVARAGFLAELGLAASSTRAARASTSRRVSPG